MRFKRHLKFEYGLSQITIAPLVNVFFLLLVFFMFTSNFALQSGLKIDLPKTITSQMIGTQGLDIKVSAENLVYLEDKTLTLAELKNFLVQVAKRRESLVIKADRRASLERVVEIWDMARDLGITQLSIATN
jgi:biopolymer transport protein ExbD